MILTGVSVRADDGLSIGVGSTRAEVIAALGDPKGEMKIGPTTMLSFEGGTIEIENGKVVRIQDGFLQRAEDRRAQAAFEAEQAAKGLVLYEGAWIPKAEAEELEAQAAEQERQRKLAEERRARLAPKPQQKANPANVREVRNGGSEVSLQSILVPGKVTIVDFFADWCGPCRQMAPYLERMALYDDDVRLCKVDIVKFGTPVTHQYKIDAIPSVWVYDRRGYLVVGPTHNLQAVAEAVRKAK